MQDPNYRSGDDYVVEFLEHRYGFSEDDFRERVAAAALRLELVTADALTPDAVDDLVQLAAHGTLNAPRSDLGVYLGERWSAIAAVGGQSLVYWLRKLVFRGAWLDHRLKAGVLDVVFDEAAGDFGYRLPDAERPIVEVATHPSWRAVRYPA